MPVRRRCIQAAPQAGQDFSNDNGATAEHRPEHLQPYDAQMAKDGTVVAGLRTTVSMKISPNGREDMVFGGDGFSAHRPRTTRSGSSRSTRTGRSPERSTVGRTGRASTRASRATVRDAAHARPKERGPPAGGGREVMQTPWPYSLHCYPDPRSVRGVSGVRQLDDGVRLGPIVARQEPLGDGGGSLRRLRLRGYCGRARTVDRDVPQRPRQKKTSAAPHRRILASDGWHSAAANGLPQRFLTSIWIDRSDPRARPCKSHSAAIRRLDPAGSRRRDTTGVGTGTCSCRTTQARTSPTSRVTCPMLGDAVIPVAGKLVAGTDVGAFVSSDGGQPGRSSATCRPCRSSTSSSIPQREAHRCRHLRRGVWPTRSTSPPLRGVGRPAQAGRPLARACIPFGGRG